MFGKIGGIMLRASLQKVEKFVQRARVRLQLDPYRMRHAGRPCLIIGNGPSVRVADLERIPKEYVTFCCNRFHLAYSSTSFRPMYTVVIDPFMIEDFGKEILRSAKTPVFMGYAGSKKTIPGAKGVRLRGDEFCFSRDIREFVSTGDSVVVAAVQIAAYMGAGEIYLYGIDHSFSFQVDQDAAGVGLVLGEGNHFIENYRSGRPWCPPNTAGIERSLQLCDEYLRDRGGFLKNVTRGGRLNTLERGCIDDLLEAVDERS